MSGQRQQEGQRVRQVTEAFVEITNSLVDGYDIVDLYSALTEHCASLLDIASAGLLLADGKGVLHVVAASSEATRDLELFQLQRQDGPCLDSFRTGAPVAVPDLSQEHARWPEFVPAALAAGFASVHAVPMRIRDTRLGTLGLFGTEAGPLNDDDRNLSQALAHVASMALVSGRAADDKAAINAQLQEALTSRVIIEQAKGVLAHAGQVSADAAFARLRHYAREHDQPLAAVARQLADTSLPATDVLAAHSEPSSATKLGHQTTTMTPPAP